MKIVTVNGSPRKNYSTAKLLDAFAEGVRSVNPEIEVERVNLYDLRFHGCISCFGCKLIGSVNYGRCVVADDLRKVLESIDSCDGFAIGMPIYFGIVSGESNCMIERLAFAKSEYKPGYPAVNVVKVPVQTFYTMNSTEKQAEMMGYFNEMDRVDGILGHVMTHPDRIVAYDTYQFRDYSKYESSLFDEAEKRERRDHDFPRTLAAAHEAGAKMARAISRRFAM